MRRPRYIISADWGKEPRKREAVLIDVESSAVELLPRECCETVGSLVEAAPGPGTLVGIDAVIGVPDYIGRSAGARGFLDWLAQGAQRPGFWDAAVVARDWSPWRPFWVNPPGRGSQKELLRSIRSRYPGFPPGLRLARPIDRWTRANPPTCVSGIPGSVGSGTRALWQDLAGRDDAIWPFSGSGFGPLLAERGVVIAESYPRISYGIVLAESLPAAPLNLAKTRLPVRAAAMEALAPAMSGWASGCRIAPGLCDLAVASEDVFDALLGGLALLRMSLEGRLEVEERSGDGAPPAPDPVFEGGIVGSWCVVKGRAATARLLRISPVEPVAGGLPLGRGPFECPIPRCDFVFATGRRGWDGHAGSLQRHPDWHPSVADPAERMRLFRSEYPEFFRS